MNSYCVICLTITDNLSKTTMYYDHESKKIKLMHGDRKCEDIDGNDIDDLWQSLYSYKTCCHNV